MQKASTPEQWYEILKTSIENGDLDQAANLFDDKAVFVVQPGQLATDAKAIREGLSGLITMKTKLNFEHVGTLIADNICFARAKWTMSGTGADGVPMQFQGESTDVLRQQADSSWRILIDNAYGSV